MGRAPCCPKDAELKKGAWTPQEDSILTEYIRLHGDGGWKSLPQKAGLKRCGKSCRLRWLNYLRPHINRGNFSEDEEELIIRLHGLLGNRWSLIAGRLPGRTDNQIKNYWNTRLCKKLPRKTETFKSCQENQNNLEVIPVKTTAVRVEKDFMIDMNDSNMNMNMNMMSSLHDLLMDESTTHHDLQFVDYSFVDNKNSSLEMINAQISSSDSFGLLQSPDCNLFSPMDFSTMDIRIEESPMNVMKEDHDEFKSNVEQQWSFTVCDDQGMEEFYNRFLMGEF